jgi:hypothetical protein
MLLVKFNCLVKKINDLAEVLKQIIKLLTHLTQNNVIQKDLKLL